MNGPALLILNFTIYSAIIVGVAALTTLLFGKKLRAKSRYILWVIVLLRLCVPFSLNMLPVSPVERLPEPSFLNSVTERSEPSLPAADAAFLPSPNPVTSSHVIGTDTPSSINGEATDENVSAPRAGQPSAAVEQNTEINENGEPFLKKTARAAVKTLPYLIVFVSAVTLSVRLMGYTVYSKRFGKTLRDPDERESAVYYGVCSRVGITSPPELKKSKSEHSPMLLGFFRPRIVLPDVGYTEEELKTILTHEILHYKRKDHLLSLASAFVLSLLWFDPFAYLAVRFYRREAEISCDEASTNGEYGLEKEEYGASLLSVIQKTACGKKRASTDLFSSKSELKKRFEAIASKTVKKKGYALLAACLVLSSLLGVFVGCEKDNAHDADDYTEDGVRFVSASALYGEERPQSEEDRALASTLEEFITPLDELLGHGIGRDTNGKWSGEPYAIYSKIGTDGDYKAVKIGEIGNVEGYTPVTTGVRSYLSSYDRGMATYRSLVTDNGGLTFEKIREIYSSHIERSLIDKALEHGYFEIDGTVYVNAVTPYVFSALDLSSARTVRKSEKETVVRIDYDKTSDKYPYEAVVSGINGVTVTLGKADGRTVVTSVKPNFEQSYVLEPNVLYSGGIGIGSRPYYDRVSVNGALKRTYGELSGSTLTQSEVRPFPEKNASVISFVRASGNGEKQTYEFLFDSDEPSRDAVPEGMFVDVRIHTGNNTETTAVCAGDRAEDRPQLSSHRWASAGYDAVRGQYVLRTVSEVRSVSLPVILTFYIKSEHPADPVADKERYITSLRGFIDAPEGEITCILAERINGIGELDDRRLCDLAYNDIRLLYELSDYAVTDVSANHPTLLYNVNEFSRDNDKAENVYYPLYEKEGDKTILKAVRASEYRADPNKYAVYYRNSAEIMYEDENGELLEEVKTHLDTLLDRDLYSDRLASHCKHVEFNGKNYLFITHYDPNLTVESFSAKHSGNTCYVKSRSEKEAVVAYALRPYYYANSGYDTEELRLVFTPDGIHLEEITEKHEGRYDELFFFKNLDREQAAKASDSLLKSPESEDGKYNVTVFLKNKEDYTFFERHGLKKQDFGKDHYALTLDLDQIKDILNDSNVRYMELKNEYDKFLGN